MDLEVVGRHALFFDDDSMAAFVNSPEALVDWNSLSIDRYDVRHLLSAPPPPRKRRSHQSTPLPSSDSSALEAELDHERYLDLPPPIEEEEDESAGEPDVGSASKQGTNGAYNALGFSYGNASANQKLDDMDSNFQPPFPVPEELHQNLMLGAEKEFFCAKVAIQWAPCFLMRCHEHGLCRMPPTEKIHQIIARTATFVRKNGGQSEIVLRVKQGDNPTFGFLMPDHHLYPYYRFLVDHQELLISESNKKPSEGGGGVGQVGGALSLLGSAYDSGEDEDSNELAHKAEEVKSMEDNDGANMSFSHGSENRESSSVTAAKAGPVSKHRLSSLKEKASLIRKNNSLYTLKGGAETGTRKDGEPSTASSTMEKTKLPATAPKIEQPVLEPPSDLKRSVDKIVEFIVKNGRELESILREQDREHGRFPFLLLSNQYHSYYVQALEKAQQSKVTTKKLSSRKNDAVEKKSSASKESNGFPVDFDIPYDSYRKGKFKMVIGKTKKDDQEQPSKDSQQQIGVSVDAAAAAAILQAATRGIKNPTLDILPRTSFNGSSQGPCSEAGPASSFGSLSVQKLDKNAEQNVPLSAAYAKTAALAAASEADSSEASLTREQKLKAERLRRAKMFTAMLKKSSEPKSGNLSEEPSGSVLSGSGAVNLNLSGGKRESSSVVPKVDMLDKREKIETKASDDERNERRAKRRYRSRSKRDAEDDEEQQEEGDKYKEKDHKHSKNKRRSRRSSHRSKDRHKHRKRHRHDSSEDEHGHCRRQHEHNSSSDDERHHHHRYRYDDSSDYEERHRRHRYRHHDSYDSDRNHRNERRERIDKEELEEGEISAKSGESKASGAESVKREVSLDLSNSSQPQSRGESSQPAETTEVSDDLRAKIRAMLMATL